MAGFVQAQYVEKVRRQLDALKADIKSLNAKARVASKAAKARLARDAQDLRGRLCSLEDRAKRLRSRLDDAVEKAKAAVKKGRAH